MSGTANIACPNCERVDLVRKASAIVDAGSIQATSSYGSRIHSETHLSARLRELAPTPIPATRPWGCLAIAGLVISVPPLLIGVLGLLAASDVFFSLVMTVVFGAIVFRILYLRLSTSAKDDWQSSYEDFLERQRLWNDTYYCERCDRIYVASA